MSQELRERLVRIEEKTENQGGSLVHIEQVLESLVRYVTRNEDNRDNIRENRRQIKLLERKIDEQQNWLKSRFWALGFVVTFVLGAVEMAFKLL